MCRAHATQTICRKAGCSQPIFVEAVPLHLSDDGKSTTIRHPFCSEVCARACGENPRPRSVPMIPYGKVSKISQVCASLKSGLCVPAKVPSTSHVPLYAKLPKKIKGKHEDGRPVSPSCGERDAKLYLTPPRSPSDSGSDSDTL
ncbi:hypothetical protein BGZ81_002309 [Podila clonocystis]|nr:hypothetical protein BGZ81_002309 [Podila clonocystis]